MTAFIRLKNYLKHNGLFMGYFNDHEVKRYTDIFTVPDFTITKMGPSYYRLRFTTIFGYNKKAYSPEFRYDLKHGYWHVKIGSIKLISFTNPVFPLINELRGYNLLSNIKAGNHIIDAGAGDGFITSYFSKLVGERGKVLAFEPDPSAILDYLPKNTTVVRACLDKKTGTTKLSLSDFGGSYVGTTGLTVPSLSLRDIITRFHFSKVNYIKLDVEGAEIQLIDDLLSLVAHKKSLIVAIASYHKINGKESWILLEKAAQKYHAIFAKTIYPYHATTYLVNKSNEKMIRELIKLPAYSEIYAKVWPHGENT